MLHLLLMHASLANSSKNPTRLNFPVIVATRLSELCSKLVYGVIEKGGVLC